MFWSTGYGRGFGGSEQIANALLRRFPVETVRTILITNGHQGQPAVNSYFAPVPDEVERYVDTFPNPLLARGPAPFFASVFQYFKAAVRLMSFFRRRTPSVVHLHFVSVDVFLLALFRWVFGYRLVITFCGGDLSVARRSALARLKVRTALRCADAVTTVSREMADFLRDQFRARAVACIPNGIDCAEVRQELDSADSAVQPGHFVYIGRLHPDKRVPLLVELFKESIDAGCDRNLYIIGDGEDREPVARSIARHGLGERITMLGAMSHRRVLAVLARSRCLLLASSEEGCPNVILEAMALGIPVIATRVGGVPDLIDHGDTGYLVPAADVHGAVRYILRLARDSVEAIAMGQRCAAAARGHFDLAATVQRYLAVYQSVGGVVESRSSSQATAWPGIRSQ